MKLSKNNANRISLFFCIIGLAIAGYLLDMHFKNLIPTCTSSGCERVLGGQYSMFLGLPVAGFGLLYYVVTFGIILFRLLKDESALGRIYFLDLFWGIIFGIYLRYLEFFKIGDICIWCWGSFTVTIILSILFLVSNSEVPKELMRSLKSLKKEKY